MFKICNLVVRAAIVAGAVLAASIAQGQNTAGEQRAEAAFAQARKSPLELRAFLEMPKGGDLHFHLGGAVYAETILKDAAEDSLCIIPTTHSLAQNSGMPPGPICAEGQVPAEKVFQDQKLYDSMVDAWSMRSFVPSAGVSGHDHFFSTPSRAGTSKRHQGEWLDEVTTRAAAQNEQYLEVMTSTSNSLSLQAAGQAASPAGVSGRSCTGCPLDG
jgi:adenosine deaminase